MEASGAVSDTVIEIENVDARMACAFGQQEYWKTGQRMAAQLLAPKGLPECKFRSGQSREIEER